MYPAAMAISYKKTAPNYSPETWDLLHRLKLAEVDNNSEYKVVDLLLAGQHHYPAIYNEHLSPTNPALFALRESSSNVQKCDEMAARYVAKYGAGLEGRAYTRFFTAYQKIEGVCATVKKESVSDRKTEMRGWKNCKHY